MHIIASLFAGMGTGLAPFFVWAAMRGSATWQDFTMPTLAAAILAYLPGIAFWMTMLTSYRLHSVEGLIQRLGFVIVLIWIFFAAARLGRVASRND